MQTQNFIDAERVGLNSVLTEYGKWTLREAVPWERGVLTVRPEKLRVAENESECDFKSRVQTVIYRGCYQQFILDNGLMMETETVIPVTEGDELMVHVPKDAVILLCDEALQRMDVRMIK